MRRIRKGREPASWKQYHLSTPGAKYEDAPKEEFRRALLAEQGHLCCYCMCSIDEKTTRIEHRRPREKYPKEQLLLHYSVSGAIESKDEQINRDLDTTLNLNLRWMKEARVEVLDGFRQGFERKHQGTWSPDVIERELKKWAEIPPGGRLMPYCGIVVHYLRKRLRRAATRG